MLQLRQESFRRRHIPATALTPAGFMLAVAAITACTGRANVFVGNLAREDRGTADGSVTQHQHSDSRSCMSAAPEWALSSRHESEWVRLVSEVCRRCPPGDCCILDGRVNDQNVTHNTRQCLGRDLCAQSSGPRGRRNSARLDRCVQHGCEMQGTRQCRPELSVLLPRECTRDRADHRDCEYPA
jgi:hypothetical protein